MTYLWVHETSPLKPGSLYVAQTGLSSCLLSQMLRLYVSHHAQLEWEVFVGLFWDGARTLCMLGKRSTVKLHPGPITRQCHLCRVH